VTQLSSLINNPFSREASSSLKKKRYVGRKNSNEEKFDIPG